jgi:hypothetical protein
MPFMGAGYRLDSRQPASAGAYQAEQEIAQAIVAAGHRAFFEKMATMSDMDVYKTPFMLLYWPRRRKAFTDSNRPRGRGR